MSTDDNIFQTMISMLYFLSLANSLELGHRIKKLVFLEIMDFMMLLIIVFVIVVKI